MNPILPGELVYVIAFIPIIIAIFWLVGRAADQGLLQRSQGRPAIFLIAALLFAASGIMNAVKGHWYGALFYGAGVAYYLFYAWHLRQRG